MSGAQSDERFCRAMLPQVSRTFALTIRLLPSRLRYTITIAYLLCRIADTIEDAANMEAAARVDLLARLHDLLGDVGLEPAPLKAAFANARLPDHVLTRDCEKVLREYWRLAQDERDAIRPSVQEMCDGMSTFVTMLAGRSGKGKMLESVAELELYCYYVAGTVGHLLTRLFQLHVRRLTSSQAERLWDLSTRFALGLQLTNIVQDVATDAERGVVYVPNELIAAEKRALGDARIPAAALNSLARLALARLWDAIDYCTCLPRTEFRIRLFCLLPPYLAVQTLRAAQLQFDSDGYLQKPRISRTAVYRTVVLTVLIAPSNTLVRAFFGRMADRIRLAPDV